MTINQQEQIPPLPEVIFSTPKSEVKFNSNGLSSQEQSVVKQLAVDIFTDIRDYRLEKCTFFAEPGWEKLSELVEEQGGIVNPRIEGCDQNLFDQHYWVAGDLSDDAKTTRTVIFDPIFGYVGLEKKAGDILSGDHLRYYREKRRVEPYKHVSEGGVRINTGDIEK